MICLVGIESHITVTAPSYHVRASCKSAEELIRKTRRFGVVIVFNDECMKRTPMIEAGHGHPFIDDAPVALDSVVGREGVTWE